MKVELNTVPAIRVCIVAVFPLNHEHHISVQKTLKHTSPGNVIYEDPAIRPKNLRP